MARALGHRSFQSQQAAVISPMATSQPTPLPDASLAKKDRPPPLALSDNARKALLQFDSRGRLMRWLTRFSMQKLAMWVQWTHFDHRRVCSEREVNEVLRTVDCFDNRATLRRAVDQPPIAVAQAGLQWVPQAGRPPR